MSNRRKQIYLENGAVMYETALSLSFFLLLVFFGFALLLSVFQMVGLERSVAYAGRFASIYGAGDRVNQIQTELTNLASSYGLSLQPSDITICTIDANILPLACNSGGGVGGSIVSISVTSTIGVPNILSFPYSSETIIRNEPF